MLFELILVSTGLSAYLYNRHKKTSGKKQVQLPAVKRKALPTKQVRRTKIFADIKAAVLGDERKQQELILNPEREQEIEEYKRMLVRDFRLITVASGVALIGALFPALTLLGIAAVLYLSKELFATFWKYVQRGQILNIYLLYVVMTIGMIANGHFFMLAIASIGSAIAMKVIKKAEETAQHQLLNVFQGHPAKLWVIQDGIEILIEFSKVNPGDSVVVNGGEIIPVDGVIQSGIATVDQQVLTGESRPVEKESGDRVFASTLVLTGRIIITVEVAGEESVAGKIGKILNATRQHTDKVTARGQKIADSLLPVELGVGAVTFAALGFPASLAALWSNLGSNMVLLGPLSTLNYLQILSRRGILIKDGQVFDALRKVDTVVFDKTGTLTLERPTVSKVHLLSEDYSEETILTYAAAVEQRLSHPIAQAIVAKVEELGFTIPETTDAQYQLGYGMIAIIQDKRVQVGSLRFMRQNNVPITEEVLSLESQAQANGYSSIYVAIDGQLGSLLELSPTLRPEAVDVINELKRRKLRLCIISGDHEAPTKYLANQ